MGEAIGVVGLTIDHASGSNTSAGSFTVTSPPSISCKAEGQFMYKGTLLFSFLGGNSSDTLGGTGAFTPGTVLGTGSIDPTAEKVKADGQLVIRDGDSGSFMTLFGTFVPSSSGTPVPNTPIPTMTDVEITNANQTKVEGA